MSDPEKVGEGMGAYIVYYITTKTTMPAFKSPENTVRRRFSDFLRLHNKMAETHLPKGRIVPPAPEKSVRGKLRERRLSCKQPSITDRSLYKNSVVLKWFFIEYVVPFPQE